MKTNITNILQKPLALVAALAALLLCSCAGDYATARARVTKLEATYAARAEAVYAAQAARDDAKNAYDAEVRRGIHTGPARERFNLAEANLREATSNYYRTEAVLGRARQTLRREENLNWDIAAGIARHLDSTSHGAGAHVAAQTAAQSAAGAAAASAASSAASAAHSSVCAPMR